jgi:hypothetical protein
MSLRTLSDLAMTGIRVELELETTEALLEARLRSQSASRPPQGPPA